MERIPFKSIFARPGRFFTNSAQYKNANIPPFFLAVPLEITKTNKILNLEI